jgi:hypothetical protein
VLARARIAAAHGVFTREKAIFAQPARSARSAFSRRATATSCSPECRTHVRRCRAEYVHTQKRRRGLTHGNLDVLRSAASVAPRRSIENALGYAKSLQSSLPQAPCLEDNDGASRWGYLS